MLLSEKKGNGDKDGTCREETHQDSVGLEKLSLGPVSDGDSDT